MDPKATPKLTSSKDLFNSQTPNKDVKENDIQLIIDKGVGSRTVSSANQS